MAEPSGWFADLEVHTTPLVDAPLRSGDWYQDGRLATPLWDTTAAAIARRVSIGNVRGLYGLLIDPNQRQLAAMLELGLWSTRRDYQVGIVEAADPIHDGFLRRLRLVSDHRAPQQPVVPAELLRTFSAAEQARIGDMEAWLRRRYGDEPPADEVFGWIDYPVFDNGSMGLGHVLLIHGAELHFWSRVGFWHK